MPPRMRFTRTSFATQASSQLCRSHTSFRAKFAHCTVRGIWFSAIDAIRAFMAQFYAHPQNHYLILGFVFDVLQGVRMRVSAATATTHTERIVSITSPSPPPATVITDTSSPSSRTLILRQHEAHLKRQRRWRVVGTRWYPHQRRSTRTRSRSKSAA
jgi:hypothetical protein